LLVPDETFPELATVHRIVRIFDLLPAVRAHRIKHTSEKLDWGLILRTLEINVLLATGTRLDLDKNQSETWHELTPFQEK
jgi:hypothetical protein